MNALLRSLVIFLYPARCRNCREDLDPADGHYICKSCWQQVRFIERPYCGICGYPLDPMAALPEKIVSCDKCPEKPWFRKARSIADYDSAAGEAIRLLKYQGKAVMAKPLADLMLKVMPALLDTEDYDYIVPVPVHKKQRRERGYNQMELIGRWLSRVTGIPMETRGLVKVKNNKSQTKAEDRLENVRGVFDVPDPQWIAGKRILLIDDVFTTGATINESSKTLAQKGKVEYVDVLTLSRVVKTKQPI